jgi:hypothetical protein
MYYIIILDMFRAILRSSSGRQNCIDTTSGIVTRPYSAPVESGLSPLANGAPYGRLQRVTIPDPVTIQFRPPEDEHSNARNVSRIIM